MSGQAKRGANDTIDVEELALREGLKPALRSTLLPREVPAFRERVSRLGLVVRVASDMRTYIDSGSQGWVPVYLARTEEAAERAQEAEARSFKKHEAAMGTADLGRALGYPACCVERFVELSRRSEPTPSQRLLWALVHRFAPPRRGPTRHELRSVPYGGEDYLSARTAWCERPDARLNHLAFRVRARLVSHAPCSYRCQPSLEYAEAVARAVGCVRPEALARLRRLLARPLLVAANAARAVVTVENRTIVSAEAMEMEGAPAGTEPILELDARLAHAAVGCQVGPWGLVTLPGLMPAVLVDFTWGE